MKILKEVWAVILVIGTIISISTGLYTKFNILEIKLMENIEETKKISKDIVKVNDKREELEEKISDRINSIMKLIIIKNIENDKDKRYMINILKSIKSQKKVATNEKESIFKFLDF